MNQRILACILLLLTSIETSAYEVVLAADEWFPINGVPGDEKPGYGIEITDAALKKNNHTLKYKVLPWERSIAETRSGSIDCIIGAAKVEVPDFVFPEEPIGIVGIAFYVRKGHPWRYENLQSLRELRLGAQSGYAYDEGPIDAFIRLNKNKGYVTLTFGNRALETLLEMLVHERIDAVIDSPIIVESMASTMGIQDKIEHAGGPDDKYPIYVACSPVVDHMPEVAKMLTDGIREMRKNGELAKIMARYGLKDWQ